MQRNHDPSESPRPPKPPPPDLPTLGDPEPWRTGESEARHSELADAVRDMRAQEAGKHDTEPEKPDTGDPEPW
jgi:hypothetical protein